MSATMTSIVWPKQKSLTKDLLLVVLGSFIIAISSQISIPLQPVPVTLQTFAVLSVGMLYGWRLGAATIALYLTEGALGLPVFANAHFGLLTLLGPSGGYLLGFLPAVALCGYLLESGWAKYRVSAFLAGFLADSIIFACGLIGLSLFIGWHNAVVYGLLPFILVELVKLIIFAFVIPACWKKNH